MNDECSKPGIAIAVLQRENEHLRELMVAGFTSRDKALELQGMEYERRLEVLNDAHARAEKAVEMTVPRTEYNMFMSEFQKWKLEMQTDSATMKATTTANMRFFTVVVSLISLAFTAISLWSRFK